MKTFEERYTAWIDGQLEGSALVAFEQELTRRAAVGEAQADRKDTQSLRHLLRHHFEAPALTNPEFFSHQLRERINSERTATGGRTTASVSRGGLFSFFPWSVARLAGTGAACLFVAGALYYGLEPGPVATGGNTNLAVQKSVVSPQIIGPATPQVADNTPTPAPPRGPQGPTQLVLASPTPTPLPLFDDSPDIKVHSASPASATALIYSKPNVNVLWTNGLDYLPDVPGAAGTPVNTVTPVPAPAPRASAAP